VEKNSTRACEGEGAGRVAKDRLIPFTVIYYYARQLHCLINILTGNEYPRGTSLTANFSFLHSVGDVFLCLSKKRNINPFKASRERMVCFSSLLFALNIFPLSKKMRCE